MTRVENVRAELRPDALAVAAASPRLSWQITAAPDGSAQEAVEFRATGTDRQEQREIAGAEQILVQWPFAPLRSREQVAVSVRALVGGEWSAWSEPLAVEGALYLAEDWTEPLVVPSTSAPHETRGSHLLRAEFTLDEQIYEQISSARLYVTAHGVFVAALNGTPVGDEHLAPGWTSYRHRLRYRTHDVTAHLHANANVLAVELADGWFRGNIGFDGGLWDIYGSHVGLLAQLEVTTVDGHTRTVALGDSWHTVPGPSTSAGLYEGESYDARRLPRGWDRPGFDTSGWNVPELRSASTIEGRLEPAINAPVRPIEELTAVTVEHRPNGRIRLDFGQNISGVLKLRVDAPAGQTITLRHSEVLENGELGVRPLRRATSVDSYISDGESAVWMPRFTIHGFRYAELEGWPGTLEPDAAVAVVLHTDMERRGWFESSDPMLNRLHDNTVWSMRDNFVDLPTDCPQRDERMGWTGDIQVFAPAAEFLYDTDAVLASWLQDVAAEQGPDGWVPNFVPWVECGFPRGASAAWGDAAVVVPWVMYQRRGDLNVLRTQWASMRGWVEHLEQRVGPNDVIEGSFELGDWLDPAAPPHAPAEARTDKYLVASAYLVRSARTAAAVGRLVGDSANAQRYTALAERVQRGMQRRWLHDLDSLGHAATALALVVEFDLATGAAARQRAGELLADAVRADGHRIPTGFVGTPIITDALASTGHLDDAYALLLQTECPSWLYPVTMGATTIWERWDSMLPDGTINPGDMTSFNHYALGAVVDFLHRVVGGLTPTAPGYREVLVRPQPGGGLTWARTRHVTPYGPVEVNWELQQNEFVLEVQVPFGITATVELPSGGRQRLSAGRCTLREPLTDDRVVSTILPSPAGE